MALDVTDQTADEVLLRRYAQGDARAAHALTDRFGPVVYRVALRFLGDGAEAEDVAQDAMMRLWRAAPGWRSGDAKVTTWLYTVTRNLCTDRLRKQTRQSGLELDQGAEPVDPTPSAEHRLILSARIDALQEALMRLPRRQREAIVLRHLEGLANPEIAQIMDISTAAVESLTARGKRALATALAARRDELGYTDG